MHKVVCKTRHSLFACLHFYSKTGKSIDATVIMPIHLLLFYLGGFFSLILREICIVIISPGNALVETSVCQEYVDIPPFSSNYSVRRRYKWRWNTISGMKRLVLICELQHFRLKSLQTASRKGSFEKVKWILVTLLKWYIQICLRYITKSALGNYCSIEAFLFMDLSHMAEKWNTLSRIAFFIY